MKQLEVQPTLPYVHKSVLLDEVMRYWPSRPDGVYVDGTCGGGGHSTQLLANWPGARLIILDQDPSALDEAQERLAPYRERLLAVVRGNFRNLRELLWDRGWEAVDGILLDLGVSSPQLDQAQRGFTYQVDAPLDMRMDPDGMVTAFRLVNGSSAEALADAFWEYGEERWAKRIAEFIVEARKREPIRTTQQLVEVIKAAIPAAARRTGGHPARRVFQALRIWVNDEMGALDQGLNAAREALAPGGHLVVISFHSLEDRMVKHRFRAWQSTGEGDVLTKRPITPDATELDENPRSRSAKLRAFQRTAV